MRCFLFFVLLFSGSITYAQELIDLKIKTYTQPTSADTWEGVATYELLRFYAVAHWSDGTIDSTLSQATPVWTTDIGWFEQPKSLLDKVSRRVLPLSQRVQVVRAAEALWSSPFGEAGEGKITLQYANCTATFDVIYRAPTTKGKKKLPGAYYADFLVDEDFAAAGGELIARAMMPPLVQSPQKYPIVRYLNQDKAEVQAHIQQKNASLQELSERLTQWIQTWHQGNQNPTYLPEDLLPHSLHNHKTRWRIMRPEAAQTSMQWMARPAHTIDLEALHFLGLDPAITYLRAPYIAPIGATIHVEGAFPHARAFSVQVASSGSAQTPVLQGGGQAEIPLIDADIQANPGHTNPFHLLTNRSDTLRDYHLRFLVKSGDLYTLNQSNFPGSLDDKGAAPFRYMDTLNRRIIGPFRYTGALGNGAFIPGLFTLRYVLPDTLTQPLAGVGLPKIWMELPTGERFCLVADLSLAARRWNIPIPAWAGRDLSPDASEDHTVGWTKRFGPWLHAAEQTALNMMTQRHGASFAENVRTRIREIHTQIIGRGATAKGLGGLEAGTGDGLHHYYLSRRMALAQGDVLVIRGKLPETPHTTHGASPLKAAELRYFSIGHYQPYYGKARALMGEKLYPMACLGSWHDAQIPTDSAGFYTLVYSYEADKPAHLPPHMRWQNWGKTSVQELLIRYIAIGPEWKNAAYLPDAERLPWAHAAWSQPLEHFRAGDLYTNQRKTSFMQAHHPVVHYLSREAFELQLKQETPWPIWGEE